jgi:hypothetical protein
MSTFKCGLRRFDGHGTSSYRPTNTAATKEMESAYSKMMRLREQQDAGNFSVRMNEPKMEVPDDKKIHNTPSATGEGSVLPGASRALAYSLSDAK